MTVLVTKAVVSGLVVLAVNIIGRRSPGLAGLLVAFPVVTLLSAMWLTLDGTAGVDIEKFFVGVLWGLLPTFVFVLTVVLIGKSQLPLVAAAAVGFAAWLAIAFLLERVGWLVI